MLLKRTTGVSCLVALLIVGFALPQAANAAPPMLTRINTSTLLSWGCEQVSLSNEKALTAAEALDWQAVVPADATGEALVYCPTAITGSLEPYGEGQVAGWFLPDGFWRELYSKTTWGDYKYYFKGNLKEAAAITLDAVLAIINPILWAIGAFLLKLIGLVAEMVIPLLTRTDFGNSEIVQLLWPLVLGLVNGGFLLALVLIALLTVLRLDVGVGGGIKKMLPRLLIAALLVNFSLAIAVLVIDSSRIVMAIIPQIMNFANLDDWAKIATGERSGWQSFAAQKDTVFGSSVAATTVKYLVLMVVYLLVVVSLLVVVVSLFMRYVMLVLLLAISPLAYLLIALPGAGGLAKKWWAAFLRYVIFGPVVLVLLIGAVKIDMIIGDLSAGIGVNDRLLFTAILGSAMFCAFVIAAAFAGKYAGVIGSAAAISVATRAGRRVRGMAYRGAKGTGRAAAKGMYVGTGARAGVRTLGRQARDFGGAVKGGIAARLPAAFKPVKRDKEGRPIPGQAPTWGQRLGRGLAGRGYTDKQQQQAREAAQFKVTGDTATQRAESINTSPALKPYQMQEKAVRENVRGDVVGESLRNSEVNKEVRVRLAGDVDAVRNLLNLPDAEVQINAALNMNTDASLLTNLRTDTGNAATDTANASTNASNRAENQRRRTNQEVVTGLRKSLDQIRGGGSSQQA